MSDQTAQQQPDIGQLVMQVPDDVWNKIKRALKAKTREEVAAAAQADPRVQRIVLNIMQGVSGDMGQQPDTMATQSLAPKQQKQRPTSSGSIKVGF